MGLPQKLTARRESFARAVASGKTQADAYRESFSVKNKKPETIWSKASILMADDKVKARVAELRAPMAKKAQITLESHLSALLLLCNRASRAKQYAAAISAEIARGKASGVHVERSELTGKDGSPLIGGAFILPGVLTPDEWEKAAKDQQEELTRLH